MLTATQSADPSFMPTIQAAINAIEAEATPDELQKGRDFQSTYNKKQEELSAEKTKKAPGLFNLF